jgi:hypothetical protein
MIAEITYQEFFLGTLSLCGGVMALFSYVQAHARADLNEHVRMMIASPLNDGWASRLADIFAVSSDSVFGERLLSVRSFAISTICSLVAFGIICVFFAKDLTKECASVHHAVFLQAGAAIVVTNIAADFVSVTQTRIFVRWAASSRAWTQSGLLILDAVLTMFLFTFFLSFSSWLDKVVYSKSGGEFFYMDVVEYSVTRIPLPEPEIGEIVLKPFTRTGLVAAEIFGLGDPGVQELSLNVQVQTTEGRRLYNMNKVFLAAPFFSTFFTSVWLWMFMIAILVARCVGLLGVVMDVERFPIAYLGAVSVVLICFASVLVCAVAALF